MADEWFQMAGQIESSLAIDRLKAALAEQGLPVRLRESCHYVTGRYLCVRDDCVEFTVEQISGGEYLARGDGPTLASLLQMTDQVSRALAGLDIRHRFEIYDSEDGLLHYLHGQWPME
jgi:hypothetical protein